MQKVKLFAVLALFSILAGLVAQPAAAADPFYTGLLERGVRDLELGLLEKAQQKLRTACFGFLDEPTLLAEGLMQLGRAQAQAGNSADLIETVERLAEIENRFNAYSGFDGPLKADFESALRRALSRPILERMPMFSHLAVPTEQTAQTVKPLTGKQRRKALRQQRAANPDDSVPRKIDTSDDSIETPVEEPPAQEAETQGVVFPEIKIGLTLEERVRRLREEIAESQFREHLEEAMRHATELADDYPDSPQAQHLAAEVAYLSSEWQAVLNYFARGGRPSADQPQLLFYLAVATYELGNAQEADSILREALPNLPRNPFVDGYINKILTPPPS